MKRARTGFGSTCQKLIDFLEADGHKYVTVFPALGAWRQHRFDVMSFEVHFLHKDYVAKGFGQNMIRCYGSWQTITEFLRKAKKNGYSITKDDELWAKENK